MAVRLVSGTAYLFVRNSPSPSFLYEAFGLRIASEIHLSELPTAAEPADVTIEIGPVPAELGNRRGEGGFFQASQGEYLLRVPNVAGYHVSLGARIVVAPEPGAAAEAVRLFLLTSAMGALLIQRGLLVLHAGAIATPAGAVAFGSASAGGKSTLAAVFQRRGYTVLADEICAVDTSTVPPRLVPGGPFLFLWSDAIKRLGIEDSGLRPVRPGLRKLVYPVAQPEFGGAYPLRAFYELAIDRLASLTLEPISGAARIAALARTTYRDRLPAQMGFAQAHFAQIGAVARHTRMARIVRPEEPWSALDIADLVAKDLEL